jgi:PAS domain S-box-containing protein
MSQKIHKIKNLPVYFFIVIFILLAAGIIIIGHYYYERYALHFRSEVSNQLSTISTLKVSELVQWRKERLGDGNVIFKNIAFTNVVKSFFEYPDDMDAERELYTWLDEYQRYYEYDLIRLIYVKGSRNISFPTESPPLSSFIYQNISEVLKSREVRFIDFYRNEYNHHIYLAILVPILDEQNGNQPLGVVVLRINPERYLFPLINRWPAPTLTAETQIVRREGTDALFLNELKNKKNTALTLSISLKNTDNPAVKAVLGEEGVDEGIDYRGVPVIADIRRVPESPWFMVSLMDVAEVYAPMRERLWLLMMFAGIIFLVTGSGLGFAWRQKRIHYYRKQYETAEALRKSDEKYRELFYNDLTGDYISDLEGKLSIYNPAFANIFGFSSAKDVSDIHMEDLYKNKGRWNDFVSRVRIERKIEFFESERKRLDGVSIYVIENAFGIFNKQNELLGIYGYIFDITKRKKAEDELQRINKELEQFAYVASHDLQEPLRSVNSFTQLLAKRYKNQLDDKANEYIGFVVGGATRMERLIHDLLTFSRMGRMNTEQSIINSNEIMERVIASMTETIKENHAVVTHDHIPFLYANETTLTQLFQNLIGNAIKFRKENEPSRVHISVEKKDNELLFSVKDNGIGINPKYFEKLFKIFQRLHSDEEYPGTGIGLATCKKIVESYGGRIWVESIEGEGSTFFFTLPDPKV